MMRLLKKKKTLRKLLKCLWLFY